MEYPSPFQKVYLSKRRLIFTDEEVHFVCNKMHISESIDVPYPSAKESLSEAPMLGELVPQWPIRNGWSLQRTFAELGERLRQYTLRQLTYDSDILDAFRGILRSFEKNDIYHIWGIPFGLGKESLYERCMQFCLCWRVGPKSQRRLGFPSWSWTGWCGQALLDAYQPIEGEDYDISTTLTNGDEVQFLHPSALASFSKLNRMIDPQQLRIHCRTISLYFDTIHLPAAVCDNSTLLKTGDEDLILQGRTQGSLTWFKMEEDVYVAVKLQPISVSLDNYLEPREHVTGLIFRCGGDLNAYYILLV